MRPTQEMLCDMCLETKQTQHFDLYISGSEGTQLCNGCERLVVQFIQDSRFAVLRKRIADHLGGSKERSENAY